MRGYKTPVMVLRSTAERRFCCSLEFVWRKPANHKPRPGLAYLSWFVNLVSCKVLSLAYFPHLIQERAHLEHISCWRTTSGSHKNMLQSLILALLELELVF